MMGISEFIKSNENLKSLANTDFLTVYLTIFELVTTGMIELKEDV